MAMSAPILTAGAIPKICSQEYKDDPTWMPVLQVVEMRKLQKQNGSDFHSNQRYRMLLSDGTHRQQAMFTTSQENDLVDQGKLRVGSIIRLTGFVCSEVQQRYIIIILKLDVIVETCDPIGEIVPANPALTRNPESLGGSELSGGGVTETTSRTSFEHPRTNQSSCSADFSKSDSGRYAAFNTMPVRPKTETDIEIPRSAPISASYRNQQIGCQNPRPEFSRPPQNSYARPPQSSYQQPPAMYMNKGPVARNETSPRAIPITALSPYVVVWTIKARVTAKGELRHFSNARGDGKVFSFDLLDSDGGEIRVTCFNSVADQFYNQIEAGRIYLISRGTLKPAQKTFNHLRNEYEIFLESHSTVQPCIEDDNSIPRQQFHFRPISDVEHMENNTVVDLIGVVSSISSATSLMRKNGTQTQKRTLHLKDMSCYSVEVTLWGNFCNAEGQTLQNMCDSGVFPVLAVKSGRLNEFNGKSIGTISSSQLFIEPDFPDARRLKEWFEKEGKTTPSVSISREAISMGNADIIKTISQIKDEKLGTSEKPDWITVTASIPLVKNENFCYAACPLMIGERQCNKKVTDNGDGKWRCDRCDQNIDECDYRYILQLKLQDHTGFTWATSFQECGEEIMGLPAKRLYYLEHEEMDHQKCREVFHKVHFSRFIFKLKVKEETFSDEQRVKSTVVKAERVKFSSLSRFFLDMLSKSMKEVSVFSVPKVESVVPKPGFYNSGAVNVESRQSAAVDFAKSVRELDTAANHLGPYNQYTSSKPTVAATSGIYLTCNSCGAAGHGSMNCPSIANSPVPSIGGGYASNVTSGADASSNYGDCYKCGRPGHWAKDCPGLNGANSPVPSIGGGYTSNVTSGAGASGNYGDCYKCGRSGHWAKDCPGLNGANSPVPSIGGGYASNVTSGAGASSNYGDCYKCGRPGHWAKDCPGLSGAPPSYGNSSAVPGRVISKQHVGSL